jgi:hypothetical protein
VNGDRSLAYRSTLRSYCVRFLSPRRLRCATRVLVALSAVAVAERARAGGLFFGPTDVTSAFFVSKSENKNQVHYAVRVDAACVPIGTTPIWGYWRMLEDGPSAVEPLLPREQSSYGIASQNVVERRPEGGMIRLVLRAMPTRAILVSVQKRGALCESTATTSVNGVAANVFNVHVKLKWPFGVSYLLVQARAVVGGRVVQEKIDD